MDQVNLHEAKTHLSRLVARVMDGERIVIDKAGKPVAVLSAFDVSTRPREPGLLRGRLRMHDDFEAPPCLKRCGRHSRDAANQ